MEGGADCGGGGVDDNNRINKRPVQAAMEMAMARARVTVTAAAAAG